MFTYTMKVIIKLTMVLHNSGHHWVNIVIVSDEYPSLFMFSIYMTAVDQAKLYR